MYAYNFALEISGLSVKGEAGPDRSLERDINCSAWLVKRSHRARKTQRVAAQHEKGRIQ